MGDQSCESKQSIHCSTTGSCTSKSDTAKTEKILGEDDGDVDLLEKVLEAPGEHAERVYLVRGDVISLQGSRHHVIHLQIVIGGVSHRKVLLTCGRYCSWIKTKILI